jgi:hypothetical protein
MARIAGTGIDGVSSENAVGATVYLIDTVADPKTVAETTIASDGSWEFTDLETDENRYHVTAEWNDGGTEKQSKSFGFLTASGEFTPASLANLEYWFDYETADTSTVESDVFVNYLSNKANDVAGERLYPENEGARPKLFDNAIQFDHNVPNTLSHAYSPTPDFGLADLFCVADKKITYSFAFEFAARTGVFASVGAGTAAGDIIRNALSGGNNTVSVRVPDTQLKAEILNDPRFVVATIRVDKENGTADIYLNSFGLDQNVVVGTNFVSTSPARHFRLAARNSNGSTSSATMAFKEALFVDRFVTLSELADIHNYMMRHFPA